MTAGILGGRVVLVLPLQMLCIRLSLAVLGQQSLRFEPASCFAHCCNLMIQ